MIQDLGCIQLENEEAIRYATTWAREGLAAAERSRKITRMNGQSESTPARDTNYMAFDMMITALAIQLVRDDLVRNKDDLAIEVVDELLKKMVADDMERTALERVLHDTQGPRSFLEQLYYRGVIEGVTKNGTKTLNVLKVAENLFDARLSIGKVAAKLLSLQSMQNRQYYKMIKDHGGFQKLDMSNTPKMKFIDLDARALDEAREDAAHASRLERSEERAATAAAIALQKEKAPSDAPEREEKSEPDLPEEDAGYSNSSGPMMM
jgi:hypothetical protein